ncbi:MAG: amidohydrolase family protein [Pseudomonadota bacterium]
MATLRTISITVVLLPFLFGMALITTARYFDSHSLHPGPKPASVILDNVNLVPVSTEGVVASRKLTIIDGQIDSIDSAGPPYAMDMEVLDLEDRYLLPGLIDMHVHVDDREQLRLALSYGVTAVRNMHGMPMHLRWMKEQKQNEWMGSRLYSTSPIMHGKDYSSFFDVVVEGEEHARRLSRQLREEGWDFIKVYSGLGMEEFLVLLGGIDSLSLPVVGHVPYAVAAENYSLAGQMRTIEHVEEIFQGPLEHSFSIDQVDVPIAVLSRANAVVCPTLSTFENLTRLSIEKTAMLSELSTDHMTAFGEYYSRKIDIERWLKSTPERGEYNAHELDFLKYITKKLEEHGVALVLGTDSGTNFVMPGPSMWQEMRLMAEAGLEAETIIRAATLNAALALGIAETYGTIEVGKTADLVLVDSNPLEDPSAIRRPSGVFYQGNHLDADDLMSLRDGTGNVAGWWLSTARYFESAFDNLTRY